jgi:hypothetical protein
MVLITILALAVLGFVGKLIYDVQQKKNKPTQNEDGFEFKDDFQKLAGIKPIEPTNSESPTNVTTKKLNEQIVEALLKAAENSEFPKSDESINVRTTKITTIDTNFGDNDPLATIPMSRISKEGKKKMAEIAKEDIKITTEAKANELISKELVTIPAETKTKRKSNPKQMDGTKSDAPFVKTKKKSTKPKA